MLYVECYADEVLVRTLGVPRREVRHEHGKGNITNRLRTVATGKGMIDEDPSGFQPAELRNYRKVQQNGSLVLMEHTASHSNQLVIICPNLEEWLYERASASGVSPAQYRLPATPQQLKTVPHYERKLNFLEFLKRLCTIDTELACLKEWIK